MTRRWVDGAVDHLLAVRQLGAAMGKDYEDADDERDIYIQQRLRLLALPDHLQLVMRYDSHLHRQTIQLMHEIEAMQARRRGEPTHLARLDINAPPAP